MGRLNVKPLPVMRPGSVSLPAAASPSTPQASPIEPARSSFLLLLLLLRKGRDNFPFNCELKGLRGPLKDLYPLPTGRGAGCRGQGVPAHGGRPQSRRAVRASARAGPAAVADRAGFPFHDWRCPMNECAPELRMYGYCIAWRRRNPSESRNPADLPPWTIEQCENYLNLPAHYVALDEAIDRAAFLRSKGVDARVVALVAEPTDSAAEFDQERVKPDR